MNGQSLVRLVFNSLQFICNSFTPLNPTIYIRNMARKEYWDYRWYTVQRSQFQYNRKNYPDRSISVR